MRTRLCCSVTTIVLLHAAGASAATLTVTTTGDSLTSGDGLCSLREAINAVNAHGTPSDCGEAGNSDNSIVLGPDTYALTIPYTPTDDNQTGDLDINIDPAVPLTIRGAGPATVISAAGTNDRAFHVLSGDVRMSDLTITGGRAPNGADSAPATGGHTPDVGGRGFSGGAIYNGSTLDLNGVTLTDNRAGNGGHGGAAPLGTGIQGAPGGTPGVGGGVYNTRTLTLEHVTLSNNFAGAGGTGGTGGSGAADTSGMPGAPGGAGGTGGAGGCCGEGGGIENDGGTLTVTASTFTADHAGTGGTGGTGGKGGSPGPGGPASAGGQGGSGAGGASGGAIASDGGTVTIYDSTFASNAGGSGGNGGGGGPDSNSMPSGASGAAGNGSGGGGLYFHDDASVYVDGATIASNASGGPGAAGGQPGQPALAAGIYSVDESPFPNVAGTVLASNAVANCGGSGLKDADDNISFDGGGCDTGFATGDPALGPLQDNGGPTFTMALGAGSAALRSSANCQATDQRGVARPTGGTCAGGAYEPVPPALSIPSVGAVDDTGATVGAAVTPYSGPDGAGLHVEYGTTDAYGSATSDQTAGGLQAVTVLTALTGLTPGTTYHYRVVATSTAGTTASTDATFATTGTQPANVPPPSGTTTTDTTPPPPPLPPPAPRLSGLKLSSANLKRTSRKSTTISYTDSLAATTNLAVVEVTTGRRSGARCVKKTKRNQRAHACTRLVTITTLTHTDTAGANTLHLTAKVGTHTLAKGHYRLQATPALNGVTGTPATVSFTVS